MEEYKGLKVVTKDNLQVGKLVVKGKDFNWPGQGIDHKSGENMIGTTTDYRTASEGWCAVTWPDGNTMSYRIGAENKYDLCYLE